MFFENMKVVNGAVGANHTIIIAKSKQNNNKPIQ